jgi:hypothetical protein
LNVSEDQLNNFINNRPSDIQNRNISSRININQNQAQPQTQAPANRSQNEPDSQQQRLIIPNIFNQTSNPITNIRIGAQNSGPNGYSNLNVNNPNNLFVNKNMLMFIDKLLYLKLEFIIITTKA